MTAAAAVVAVPDLEHAHALRAWSHAWSAERRHLDRCRLVDTPRARECFRCLDNETATQRAAGEAERTRGRVR